jgi:hypothetical protein
VPVVRAIRARNYSLNNNLLLIQRFWMVGRQVLAWDFFLFVIFGPSARATL